GAFRVASKAKSCDVAEQTAARALAEEEKALAGAQEMRKELEDSDLYAVRVEFHKERDMRHKSMKSFLAALAECDLPLIVGLRRGRAKRGSKDLPGLLYQGGHRGCPSAAGPSQREWCLWPTSCQTNG
ncbi:unnamed protein product, partial [Effrenium voratum]